MLSNVTVASVCFFAAQDSRVGALLRVLWTIRIVLGTLLWNHAAPAWRGALGYLAGAVGHRAAQDNEGHDTGLLK